MLKKLLVATLLLFSVPATAQLNLPATLSFNINDPAPTQPPEAETTQPPSEVANETYDTSALIITDDAVRFSAVSDTTQNGASQSKARFTCGAPTLVDYVDQLRGAGQRPFGHGHAWFGATSISQNIVSYSDFRVGARAKTAAGKIAARCPGDTINGSIYQVPWIAVPNALGDGVTRLKPWNIVTLYYTCPGKPSFCSKLTKIYRGFGALFGTNMDDPDMTSYRAKVQAFADAHPEMGLVVPGPSRGHIRCENSGTSYPALANYDGTAMFQCPADQKLLFTVDSNICWNGKLRTPDGYSNTLPPVQSNVSGRSHCPLEYPYILPAIETTVRYSHRGPDDYRTWRCASDDMAGMKAGRQFRNCESLHTDYIFGWDERFSDDWQCGIGIQFPGRTCTSHDMDYATIGPDKNGSAPRRLVSDSVTPNSGGKVLIDGNANFTGAKASDWITIPFANPVKGPVQIHVH